MRGIIFGCLFLTSFDSSATLLSIAGKQGTLSIELLDGFQLYRKFLGLPYAMIDKGQKNLLSH